MMTITRNLTALGAALTLSAAAAAQAAPRSAGHWEGKIHMGANEVPMTVDLAQDASGAWIGSFTVPGSTQVDVPLTGITATDSSVHFVLSFPDNPSFDGKLSADGTSISGTASNSQGSVGFDLARTGDAHVNVAPPSSVLPVEFVGRWEGAVSAEGKQLRVAFVLTPAPDGKATGTLISVDQGGQEFKASTVTVDGKKLIFESRSISAVFTGTLGDDGAITGEWSQGGARLPLALKREGAAVQKPL